MSTNYAVTDNGIIVAKGSKKPMQRHRADLAAKAANPCTGFEERQSNGQRRFDIWLSLAGHIGDKLT